MPNQELFVDVLAHIEIEKDHPVDLGYSTTNYRWNQGGWALARIPASKLSQENRYTAKVDPTVVRPCGTAFCAAGWTLALSGETERIAWEVTDIRENEDVAYLQASLIDDRDSGLTIAERAQELLGSRRYVGDEDLFNGFNKLADLYRISAKLLGIGEQSLRALVTQRVLDLQAEEVSNV